MFKAVLNLKSKKQTKIRDLFKTKAKEQEGDLFHTCLMSWKNCYCYVA